MFPLMYEVLGGVDWACSTNGGGEDSVFSATHLRIQFVLHITGNTH
jgi:hypothetical protein